MVPSHRRLSFLGPLVIGILAGLFLSGQFPLTAHQQPAEHPAVRENRAITPRQGSPTVPPTTPPTEQSAPGIQDALLRTYHFPFAQPTSLTNIAAHLKQTLKLPVVLDLAALDRQEIDSQATVQLELDGVRLKTGLKLLLDQVKLTYHVIPEDNLLILTDKEGSTDPLDHIWTTLQTLHREIHDVQDALDEIVLIAGEEPEAGPMVRKPTIIDILPDQMDQPADKNNPARAPDHPKFSKPDAKPSDRTSPQSPRRSPPTHVPLSFPSARRQ